MRVLLLDIELAPTQAYVWALFDQNVAINQIKSDWYVLSFAAKWLDQTEIVYFDNKGKPNDKPLLKKVWKLLDKTDILVTHNGQKFDAKKLNSRFISHGFKPPSSYKHIDTLKIAKKHFAFSSNKLEYLAKNLTSEPKGKNEGFELWIKCMQGDKQALSDLKRYNIQDIKSLEALYKKLYPWDNKINFLHFTGKCHCGSTEYIKNGFALTEKGRYQRFQCKNCGAEHRDGVNLLNARMGKKHPRRRNDRVSRSSRKIRGK